jgi:archaellum component FlaF (FlaF/FlaG flagellin family)
LTTTGWTALDKIDLVGLTHRGASVMVRSAPVANNISTAAASTAVADQFYEYSNATKYIPVYVAGKLAGKEHKVVIKGEGSVPSATFNYTTGKISMPNATECRFVTGEPGKPGTVSAWTDAYAGRDTVIKGASGIPQMGYIEVRKKATSKGPNSRSRVLPYKVVDAPVAFDASGNAMATDVTAMNACVVASKTADKSTGVTITYATRNNSGSEYKVTFTNGGSDLYEFRIVPQGKTLESIKAGSKIGKSAVGDHVKPGSAIYIRRAADKETGTITSDFVYAGVVK